MPTLGSVLLGPSASDKLLGTCYGGNIELMKVEYDCGRVHFSKHINAKSTDRPDFKVNESNLRHRWSWCPPSNQDDIFAVLSTS